MKFIVCVKEVPDTAEVRLDPETNTLVREGVPSIISPFDMYATEEALRMKDEHGGEVIAFSMGPLGVENNLRNLIAMGVDKAYLVSDRDFAGSDTLATSTVLSSAIKKLEPDYSIIFVGRQAIDGDTGQVGPGIAELLDIPQVMYVRKTLSINENKAIFLRILGEVREEVESQLPCLISLLKGENEPRLPSLRGMMKAKKAEIVKVTNQELNIPTENCGLDGSPTRVIKVFTPPPKGKAEIFDDKKDIQGAVDFLLKAIKNE